MNKIARVSKAAVRATTVDVSSMPDSKLCREITELVRDTESELLFNHSSRVYCFGALTGRRRGLQFDRELLYAGAMFHDMGLTQKHSSPGERFEVDGANAARDFLKARGIARPKLDLVLGIAYEEFPEAQREAVVAAWPRTPHFKEDIIQTFYDGIKHKPDTTFGNVKADVLADKDPHFHRGNFCSVIRGSLWPG